MLPVAAAMAIVSVIAITEILPILQGSSQTLMFLFFPSPVPPNVIGLTRSQSFSYPLSPSFLALSLPFSHIPSPSLPHPFALL